MVFVERVRWASRCKDAGSPDSGAIGAPEDAAARRSSAAARHNHCFAKPSKAYTAWIGESCGSVGSSACPLPSPFSTVVWFRATSTDRLSRITVTFTWPGYSS